MNKSISLGEAATIFLSNVDKKSNNSEESVKLCNFVDVYDNWAINKNVSNNFMVATANDRQIAQFQLKKGQVAITKDSETRDDIGVSSYIADDLDNTLLGYHCALITPEPTKLNGKFLNAYLHSPRAIKHFSNQASGSGQRYTLTASSIATMPIPNIDIKYQKKIGSFFSIIDRIIENNKIIISELEYMAKTIYDYWFLQFDFPDENGKPYKSSGGKMVWNEELKREIPTGWEVKSIYDTTDFCYGYPLSTELFQGMGLPVIRIRDILSDSISAYTSEKVIDKYLTEMGDLLVGMDGNFQMNYWCNKGDIVNQRIARIRKKQLPVMLIRFQIEPFIVAKVDSVARSTVGHLSANDFNNLKILIPNSNLDTTMFDNFLLKICSLKKENQELASLRDFLLPMLMNGQVTFKE